MTGALGDKDAESRAHKKTGRWRWCIGFFLWSWWRIPPVRSGARSVLRDGEMCEATAALVGIRTVVAWNGRTRRCDSWQICGLRTPQVRIWRTREFRTVLPLLPFDRDATSNSAPRARRRYDWLRPPGSAAHKRILFPDRCENPADSLFGFKNGGS